MRAVAMAILAAACAGGAWAQPARPPQTAPTAERTAHLFTFEGLTGGEIRMADYRGQVVMVVNTASECGFTPQYEGLQKLYESRKAMRFVIVGVPSNDFGGQEPGSAREIARFCKLNYGVTFAMAAKSPVTGPTAHPFYRWALTAFGPSGAPQWNFHKLVIGKDGRPVAAFPSKVKPDAPEVRAAIDQALAAP